MCRLVAVIDRRPTHARDLHGLVESMRDTMQAGGPDDAGAAWFADGQVALGHRRLSVIELSPLGHQPMASGDGRYHIVFNGEIYNHAELRTELEALGQQFKSHSDTEVIIAAYATWGVDAFNRFRGMWAFALWDEQEQSLLLCRDRVGVKPLYWYHQDGLTLVASELKALYAHPDLQRVIDPVGMRLFLQYNYIPAPYTICRGVQKLQPGSWLRIARDGAVTRQTWYRVADHRDPAVAEMDEATALTTLESRLREAFRYRLVSDVPVGLFLSGGIDSSLLLALLRSETTQQLQTFTIGFSRTGIDEAPRARAIANALGSIHHEFDIGIEEALKVVDLLPQIWDEPFADASALPTWLVAQFARQHVTVALSADGGDELFGGYPKYWRTLDRARRLRACCSLNRLRAKAPRAVMQWCERTFGMGVNKVLKTADILRSPLPIPQAAFSVGQQAYTDSDIATLVCQPGEAGTTAFASWDEHDPDLLNRLMAIDLATYHVDDIHVKVDRATMAHGLEGREPLVDHRLIEFAASLPSTLKVRDGSGKYLLRQLLKQHLPAELVDGPKFGFSPPLNHWLEHELKDRVDHYLDPERLRTAGIFNPKAVAHVRQAFARRHNDNTQKLWNLVVFEQWREHWGFATA